MSSRILNSIYNFVTSIALQVIKLLLKFFARTALIQYIGMEYVGIDSIFTNILMLLSVSEMGIGTAIIFDMYKPIALNEHDRVKSFVKFYKDVYKCIAILIVLFGFLLTPFLDKIIDAPKNVDVDLYAIYYLYLLNTVVGYFYAYKRSVLEGYQKSYLINICRSVTTITINLLQIIAIISLRNYYCYIYLLLVQTILENLLIAIIVNKKYSYLKGPVLELEDITKKRIFKNTLYIFANKITGIILSSSTILLLSFFYGIVLAAKYSNYMIIIDGVATFLGYFLVSFTASVGNKIATSNSEEIYQVFKRLRLLYDYINIVIAVVLLLIINDFITIWIGSQNEISTKMIWLCVSIFFLNNNGNFIRVFKIASGLFKEYWYIYLCDVIISITLSILLNNVLGCIGILLGVVLGFGFTLLWAEPFAVYKKCFCKNYIEYYYNYIYNIAILIFAYLGLNQVFSLWLVNDYIDIFIKTASCLVSTVILVGIPFSLRKEISYYKSLSYKFIDRIHF